MDKQQEAFLRALQQNENDNTTRLIYADWLEEHDMPEEAERMRNWQASKDWLIEWTRSINYRSYNEEGYPLEPQPKKLLGNPHTYEDTIQAGYEAIHERGFCWGTDDGADFFRESEENSKEFFKHWSIVTGVYVPDAVVRRPGFRCAC